MLTKLKWPDITAKVSSLAVCIDLSDANEERMYQLAELARRVGFAEGRASAMSDMEQRVKRLQSQDLEETTP